MEEKKKKKEVGSKIKKSKRRRRKIPQEKEEREYGRLEKRSARASGIGRGREPREKATQPSNALLLPDKVVSVIVVFYMALRLLLAATEVVAAFEKNITIM
ncbi:hypothetical protein CEXT_776591 [Caerostris extrusa]|uniref:Uncharacterized protein n=1 Tax=Caerostris extrusa TaxID=172846 RepID=A0AAV4WH89_CAEEX|nr:hypothetical protein CEXT_776591 [Caerostris extrusa]